MKQPKRAARTSVKVSSQPNENVLSPQQPVGAPTKLGQGIWPTPSLITLTRGSSSLDVAPQALAVPSRTTDFETLTHFLKSLLGLGIFSLPYAFKHAGLTTAIIATTLLACLFYYTTSLLVKCSHVVSKEDNVPHYSYAMTVFRVLQLYGGVSERWANVCRVVVLGLLVLECLSACMIYSGSSAIVLSSMYHWAANSKAEHFVCVLVQVPYLALLSFIKSLKYLAPISLFGNVSLWTVYCFTFYFIGDGFPAAAETSIVHFTTIQDLAQYFSIVVFAFASATIIMSIENEMKTPNHFIGCPSVACIGTIFLGFIYTVYGAVGYWRYGTQTEETILLNFPDDDMFAFIIRTLLVVSMACTFSLAFYVAFLLLWEEVTRYMSETVQRWLFYPLKLLTLLLVVIVNIPIPKMSVIMSLSGAIIMTTMQFILPPTMYTIVMWRTLDRIHAILAAARLGVFLLFGLSAAILGTKDAVSNIYDVYHGTDIKI